MFQFRRFPSYAYFIQRRMLEYCSSGFPHSEIYGSKLMCSSPQLIAACHVLHRFLMPRHSPCALISLTYLQNLLVLHRLNKNHAGFRVCSVLPHHSLLLFYPFQNSYCRSVLKFHNFKTCSLLLALLPSGIIITLFSFQGAASNLNLR